MSVEDRLSKLEDSVATLKVAVNGLATAMTAVLQAQLQQPPSREDLDLDREVVLRNGDTIKLKDVPIDPETGQIEETWATEHCNCPEHDAKRKAQGGGGDSKLTMGQYL